MGLHGARADVNRDSQGYPTRRWAAATPARPPTGPARTPLDSAAAADAARAAGPAAGARRGRLGVGSGSASAPASASASASAPCRSVLALVPCRSASAGRAPCTSAPSGPVPCTSAVDATGVCAGGDDRLRRSVVRRPGPAGGSAFSSTALPPAVPADCRRGALRASAALAATRLRDRGGRARRGVRAGRDPVRRGGEHGLDRRRDVRAGCDMRRAAAGAAAIATAPVATATSANPAAASRSDVAAARGSCAPAAPRDHESRSLSVPCSNSTFV